MLVRVANPPDVDPAAGARRPDGGGRASRISRSKRRGRARCSARRCRSRDAIRQWANLGAFVDALHRVGLRPDGACRSRTRSPNRAARRSCPGSRQIKQAAADAGALGCSLSGSGPSLFALCRDAASRGGGGRRDDARPSDAHIGGEPQTYVSPIAPHGARVVVAMQSDTQRAPAAARRRRSRSTTALFDGLAPDGGLYVPETIERWTADELATLPRRTLTEIGAARAAPVHARRARSRHARSGRRRGAELSDSARRGRAGVFALELFHGPTLAFKDVGARVMARLMAALHRGDDPLTDPRRDVGRHRQRRRARVPRRAAHARRRSCIPTAASARRRKRS